MKRFVLSALALLCAAAPAHAQESARLPLVEIVDSAGLHRALAEVPAAPAGAPRRSYFRVHYDSAGTLTHVSALVREPTPGGYDSTMVALLRSHLAQKLARPLRANESGDEVLWLRSGPSPVVALAPPLRETAPALRNQDEMARLMREAVKRVLAARPELAGRQGSATVAMYIGVDGVPANLRYVTGPRDPNFQREVLGIAAAARFRPGALDGVPVPTEVQVPIDLQLVR